MMSKKSFISLLLVCVMILGVFTDCGSNNNENNTENSESIESSTEEESKYQTETENNSESASESEHESDSETKTESETEYNIDKSPLALETPKDLYPDCKEYEKVVSKEKHTPPTYTPFDVRVEAENYDKDSCTIIWSSTEKSNEYSGGAFMRVLSSAPKGWESVYSVSYTVTVPNAGYYSITALTSKLSQEFTSDYFIDVNGERQVVAAETGKQIEDIDYSFDKGLFYIYDFGNIILKEGKNTITFTIDNVDSQASQNRISFFFDYFTLTAVKPDDLNVGTVAEIKIGTDISNLENSAVIEGAAAVSVFDQSIPLKLTFSHYFKEAGEITYTIKDYFDNAVYEGKLSGEKYDIITIERIIKNHPTGYFTFSCGEQKFNYVVTSPYYERTLEDSPFAMDYAAVLHNRNLKNCYNLSAAARLAGVTWVRERASWASYESTKGVYNFSYSDDIFKTIHSTGMKILVDLCPAPSWTTKGEGYTGTGRVGGFRNNQLAFYNTAKAMVTHYKGIVDAWELWNESDHGFAVETAELFAAWYKAGALGVIDADPNMIVSFGGFCIPDTMTDYVHLSMMNDILEYSSVYNYHSHTQQPSNYSFIAFEKTAMAKYAHPTITLYNQLERPVWLTEAGMRIDNMVPKSYKEQATYIITSTVQSLSIGTEKHFWFLLSPYMESGGDFGTFSPNFEPYPTLAAENTLTSVLGQAEYVGELTGLPKNAYGYVFYTGSRMASVVWTSANTTNLSFNSEHPVIVTDMMGNKELVSPTDGSISLKISPYPIFITYTTAPENIAKQKYDDAEIKPLTFTTGQRVVLSPEFENYNINDTGIKKNGHLISDGLKIKVRVSNFNNFEVKGKISATLSGFEVQGCDQEITVAPFSEAFITLTLKKTGADGINGYITFTGNFNGEETSNATAHVYTKGTEDTGSLTFAGLKDGGSYNIEKIESIKVKVSDVVGTPVVYLNEEPIDTFTTEDNLIYVDLSDISVGKYTLVVSIKTDDGDYIFTHMFLKYDGTKVTVKFP